MRNSIRWACSTFLTLIIPAALSAQQAMPLALNEVLESSRRHAPQVLEAIAKVRQAEGKALSADGAFDTVVKGEGQSRVFGFYDGQFAEGTITRPLENFGGSVYGGYRVSRGRFPIYEDERYTNKLGEIKIGAALSLLRDRMIDERRFGRSSARIDIDIAQADRLLTAIGIQGRAIGAYNLWVAAGLRLKVYRDLLGIAQDRQAGLKRQVTLGARPAIILTENEQNVLRRETLVVRSEQELATAANGLSLFLRDANGAPVLPDNSRLPANFPPPAAVNRDARFMIDARPDIRQLDLRIKQASERLALDRNGLLPRLDLKVEASQDIGRTGFGGSSRNGTDVKVGVSFTLPLERRVAKGKIAQTNAEIDAIRLKRQQTEEQVIAAIDAVAIDVRTTARLLALAEAQFERATAMARAENRRFQLGASDFFLVNVREEAAADAAIAKLDAAYRQIVAGVQLSAATADLPALGLE